MKKNIGLFVLIGLFLNTNIFSQDPNFHIYLCFGQSNMEGQGIIESQDKTVDSRFKVMEAVDCSSLTRTKGTWYTATPPLCRCYSGLSPVDYFGRTMVLSLPSNIKVGIINVSVAGCKIELFDKNNYQTYVSSITEDWLKNIIKEYGGNPYARLVEMAKLAQKDGVIKGILLHQGESNVGDAQWTTKVKGIYENLIADLALKADSVPLLAGEVVNADQGGICASANSLIAALPKTLPNSFVISSSGCTDASDNVHFNSAGYREIGKRYAIKMLSLMGIEAVLPQDPPKPISKFFEAECTTVGKNFNIVNEAGTSNGNYITVKAGLNSPDLAPNDSASALFIPFTLAHDGKYNLYAHLKCPTVLDDSYWIKIDSSTFVKVNGLTTSYWQWLKMISFDLKAGDHILTITYCEDGAKLDKLCITNDLTYAPMDLIDVAENKCVIAPIVGLNTLELNDGYTLAQNNPNPFKDKTSISFIIPFETFVSLKVFNIYGSEIAELAGKKYTLGQHTIEFNAQNLPKGIYFYTMKAKNFSISKKMIQK